MKKGVAAAKLVENNLGRTYMFLNVFEHVKALIFFIGHPNITYDPFNDIYRDADGSIYDSDGHYIDYEPPQIY
jgi:hypothetical protein